MPNKYTYKITRMSLEDMDGVLKYISENLYNHKAANALYSEILNAIDNACEFPLSGTTCEDYQIYDINIRKVFINNYVMVYEILEKEEQINILRFKYAKMDLNNITLKK